MLKEDWIGVGEMRRGRKLSEGEGREAVLIQVEERVKGRACGGVTGLRR